MTPLLAAACSSAGDPAGGESAEGTVVLGQSGSSSGSPSPPVNPECVDGGNAQPPDVRAQRTDPYYPFPGRWDGDNKTDLAVFNGTNWLIDYAADGFGNYVAFGPGGPRDHRVFWPILTPPAIPVPADYDGDGKMDIAMKDNGGHWYVDESHDGFGAWNDTFAGYGDNSGVPTPADFDGDGHADIAIRGFDGWWRIDLWKDGLSSWNYQLPGYGNSGYAAPADYDGDHKADLAIKGSDGVYYIDHASNGFGSWDENPSINMGAAFGSNAYVPAPADYDNDGKADIALLDPTGHWSILYAANFPKAPILIGFHLATPTGSGWISAFSVHDPAMVPVPGDFDGDGRADLAVQNAQAGLFDVDYASNGFGRPDVAVTRDNTPNPRASNAYAYPTCSLAPYDDWTNFASILESSQYETQYGYTCAPAGTYYAGDTNDNDGLGTKIYYALCTEAIAGGVTRFLSEQFYAGRPVPTGLADGPTVDTLVNDRCLGPPASGQVYVIWPE